jgi:hypothetical protein
VIPTSDEPSRFFEGSSSDINDLTAAGPEVPAVLVRSSSSSTTATRMISPPGGIPSPVDRNELVHDEEEEQAFQPMTPESVAKFAKLGAPIDLATPVTPIPSFPLSSVLPGLNFIQINPENLDRVSTSSPPPSSASLPYLSRPLAHSNPLAAQPSHSDPPETLQPFLDPHRNASPSDNETGDDNDVEEESYTDRFGPPVVASSSSETNNKLDSAAVVPDYTRGISPGSYVHGQPLHNLQEEEEEEY